MEQRAPSEITRCEKIEPPVTPPNSMLDEFMKLTKAPDSRVVDTVAEKNSTHQIYLAKKEIFGKDGLEMTAQFEALDHGRLGLFSIEDSRSGQRDGFPVSIVDDTAPWHLSKSYLADEAKIQGEHFLDRGPNLIELSEGASPADFRQTVEWNEDRIKGNLKMSAYLNEHSAVLLEQATLFDKSSEETRHTESSENRYKSVQTCPSGVRLGD